MSDSATGNGDKDAGRRSNVLPGELRRLVDASKAGEFSIVLDAEYACGQEAETLRLLNEVIANYHYAAEYDLMKYKLANDALNIALWDMSVVNPDPFNPENKITWSQEFRRMLGYTDEDDFPDIFQSWSDRLHPEDKEMAFSAFEAHLADRTGNTPFNVEYRLMLKSGEYRYFYAFGTCLRDEDGVPLRVAGAIMDITEKKQMAEALNDALFESKRTLDNMTSILNKSGAMIYVTDPDNDTILFVSDHLKRQFGIEGDVTGAPCYLVLRTGVDKRCDFCPCHQLDKESDKVVVWEERSNVTKSYYRNVDRYVDWPGGKKAHIQVVTDLTDIKESHQNLEIAMKALERRERMMDALNKTAVLFLSHRYDSFEAMMTAGVELITDILDLDRVSVWSNFVSGKSLHASQIYRWERIAGGSVSPARGLHLFTYALFAPRWESMFMRGELINSPVSLLPEADSLALNGMVSVFITPVFINNLFWGFVLFEDHRNERFFEEDYVEMMRSAAFLYANTVNIRTMEAEADEANYRLQIMLDSNPLICILRDENNDIIDCNQEALKNFGVATKRDFIMNYQKFYPEFQPDGANSLEKSQIIIADLLDKGFIESFEWTFQDINGEKFPVETTLVLLRQDESTRILSYSRDLREIKAKEQELLKIAERERKAKLQREAAQAANEAKSRFLARMSHEIRTPMNAILGMSELLLQERLSSDQFSYVKDIKTASTALLNIINDILDISKIQAGKLSLVPVHYDFNTLIDGVASVVRFLVEDKYIAFILDLKEGIPECLYGDDIRLRQVLLNLTGNAVKFTKEGYVKLSVEATETSILFTVSDTGMGIKAEDAPRLFWDFEQLDTIKNRDIGGTGLGLPIAKALLEMMGGQISMESVYGQGTSFHVEIPKVLGDKTLISNADDNVISIYAPEAKVLVVDDNEMNLNVASGLLRLFQVTAETAVSGRQAIDMIREKEYDLVFMDYMMPEMDGIEATKIIRELGLDVVIIAFTANATTGARETMLEAGMDGYLSKPVIKKELAQILSSWLPSEKIIAAPLEAASAAPGSEEGVDPGQEEGEAAAESDREFWKKIDKIAGLSLKIGLDRVDGQRDVFERTLRLMLKEIEKTNKNLPQFLAVNDMPSFCTEVHGIKGALANMGVMELAEKARLLEFASRDGEAEFCAQHLPSLLEELNKLDADLREAFTIISSNADQNGASDQAPMDILPKLLSILDSLMSAITDFDIVQIDMEIEKLNKLELRGALKEEIEQLKDAVLMMEYDEATELIRRLNA